MFLDPDQILSVAVSAFLKLHSGQTAHATEIGSESRL